MRARSAAALRQRSIRSRVGEQRFERSPQPLRAFLARVAYSGVADGLHVGPVVVDHHAGAGGHGLHDHGVRAAHFGRRDEDGRVAEELAVRGPELVAGEEDAVVPGRAQLGLVLLRVGGVADDHQAQVGLQPSERLDEHVRVVLRHEPADEEDVAARREAQTLERAVGAGRPASPGAGGRRVGRPTPRRRRAVLQLGSVGDVDGLVAVGAVQLLDGARVGDRDRGEGGRRLLRETEVAARPGAPLGAVRVQTVDVDGGGDAEEPAEPGERAVAGDEVDRHVGAVHRPQVQGAEQRVHGRVEVLAGHGGEVDEPHAAVVPVHAALHHVRAAVDGDLVAALDQPGPDVLDGGLEAAVGGRDAACAHEGYPHRGTSWAAAS